jgi:hypothetical protein
LRWTEAGSKPFFVTLITIRCSWRVVTTASADVVITAKVVKSAKAPMRNFMDFSYLAAVGREVG